MIDLMELSNDITRFLNEDQYLEEWAILHALAGTISCPGVRGG